VITGWRRFHLTYNQIPPIPHYVILYGATGYGWPGREVIAECAPMRDKHMLGHNTRQNLAAIHLKAGECKCGIYITRDRNALGAGVVSQEHEFTVIAAITGWGAFVEYELGWRTQFARLEALFVAKNTVPTVKKPEVENDLFLRYGIPVSFVQHNMCCSREHAPQLFRVDGEEVPICQLPSATLLRYHELYLVMYDDYGNKMCKEFEAELQARGISTYMRR